MLQASEAVAAMLGFGVMFHKAEVFSQTVMACEPGELPIGVCVDLTLAHEPDEGLSFLTHGMPRHGREDLYISCPRQAGADAFELASLMVRWMLTDPDKQFPSGDTVGRTEQERLEIRRRRSPVDSDATVIWLDL